jgi:peptide/nickel transport system permease protein
LDLGHSFITNRDVTDDFLQRFPATIELTLAAMTFAIAIGIPLGMYTAKRHGTWSDSTGSILSLIGISIPIFFLGLMLKFLFAIQWPILPDSGRIDLTQYDIDRVTNFMLIDTLIAGQLDAFVDAARHLILPAIALGTIPLAIIMRITRASVIDVMNEDYVRTANAKGLSGRTVDNRHVLRNALLPVVTVIGLQLGLLLGGAILTETIFGWGGVGKWIYDAVRSSDYQVIQSGVLLLALIFILVNLVVDVSYAYINPRIRYS